MVKRFSWHSYGYLLFAVIILLVSWEHNRALAAVVDSAIPQESIRLRILANSDSVLDQALKRHVRDAIVEQMNEWVLGPTSLEEARELVRERLPQLEAVVERQIARYGYDYTYQVELGAIPFPAKMYGNKVYPAGEYEAVRVTIGQGAGENWWCVLFPPLCFVNVAKGEAVVREDSGTVHKAGDEQKEIKAKEETTEGKSKKAASKKQAGQKKQDEAASEVKEGRDGEESALSAQAAEKSGENEGEGKRKVGFYLWDKLKSWFA